MSEVMEVLATVKKEIKVEEDFDDFLLEYLLAVKTLEGNAGLDHEFKTETLATPTLSCKRETFSLDLFDDSITSSK